MNAAHAARALWAIGWREAVRFVRQTGRLLSAIVRPTLWLIVFAAGFRNALGVSIIPPYQTYVTYQEYLVPGLLGIVLLFNGMLSSLALVYDREMGIMRLILTAPLPRWYLLFCKLVSGAVLSVLQAYAFLVVAFVLGVRLAGGSWISLFPALLAAGLMLGAIGLFLAVHIRQLENFAGTMNFVIFPMFFLSSALYPLWKLQENDSYWLHLLASTNPFTYAVELIRFAAYRELNLPALAVVAATAMVAFLAATIAYDPQRGLLKRRERPA